MLAKKYQKILAVSILAPTQRESLKKLEIIKRKASHAFLHIDVLDGTFVAKKMWCKPKSLIGKLSRGSFETHLMVANPLKYAKKWHDLGARRIFFHVDAVPDALGVIHAFNKLHIRPGIALNPATPVRSLSLILPHVRDILFMSVQPGAGGQRFIVSTLGKIRLLRARYPNMNIAVDGGVHAGNIDRILKAGANRAISGTAIFNGDFS